MPTDEKIAWRDAEIARLRASNARLLSYVADLELALVEADVPIPQGIDTRPIDDGGGPEQYDGSDAPAQRFVLR